MRHINPPAAAGDSPTAAALTELGERYFRAQHTFDPWNATLLGLTEFDHLVADPRRESGETLARELAAVEADLADIDESPARRNRAGRPKGPCRAQRRGRERLARRLREPPGARLPSASTRANINNEVDRYIAWPGQALAYLMGQREILRLRQNARNALGDRFDLADFQTCVLGHGLVPLSVLARTVNNWQQARQNT